MSSNDRFDAVVFDLDGTLIESDRDIADALNESLTSLGLPAHELSAVRRMIGNGVRPLIERALGQSHAHRLAEARDRFRAAYEARLVRTTRLYPGVPELLAALSARGLALAVATNKPAEMTRRIAEALGLAALGVSALASGDESARPKPDPHVIKLALARAGRAEIEPSRVLYVGDMPVDVATGRAFGAYVAGAGWGFDPEGLGAAGPDRVLATPAELLSLL